MLKAIIRCRFSLKILLIFVDIYDGQETGNLAGIYPLGQLIWADTRYCGHMTEPSKIIRYYHNFLEF